MFGGFTFLWLCSRPVSNLSSLVILFLISVALGSLIELLQGALTFLGRSMEFMDAVADGVGGMLGIGLFSFVAYFAEKRKDK